MKNTMICRMTLSLLLLAAPLMAEEAASTEAAEKATSTTEVTKKELHEVLGYVTALSGGVSSLQLDEAAIANLAGGLHKALTDEIDVTSIPQTELQAAFGEAQARAQAVQASSEELPAISEGALEKIGAVVSMQSGLKQLGFGADEADAIRDGFIQGASATEMDPAIQKKMPAFQAFMQKRMEAAQSAMQARKEEAQKEAMAEFESVSKEWSEKENMNVVLETTQGDIEVELYPKEAPLAVANFVGHIKSGYYNGIIFHRVIDGFMIQGGDPLGTGTGGESIWGKPFPDEFSKELRFNEKGLLAMANSGPTTNGSQFFITTSTPSHLNDRHTIFGKVVSGYDNVEKIEKTETNQRDKPVEEQKIIKAYVKE